MAGYPEDNPAARVARPAALKTGLILSIIIGYDATTLREQADPQAALARLDELGELRSLSALEEKITLLRLIDRLDEAALIASEAVRLSRFTGDRQQLASSRIRRAQVLQYQGKLDEAQSELSHCVQEAEAHEWLDVAASARENRGKVHFDQGNYEAAAADFTATLFLRERAGATPQELENSLLAVAVIEKFIAADDETR